MTVAAVILFARGADGALADAAGRSAARRIVESAWSGGATPIVVVCADPEGSVAAALAGSPAILAEPAPDEAGPVGQIVRGITVARERVTETEAALIWPGRMTWVDAETVTSMIEAFGGHRDAALRPRYRDELGWPTMIPISALDAFAVLPTSCMPDELLAELAATGVEVVPIDTGDPGTANDITASLESLPPYDGPPEPVNGPAPEWGSAAAEMPDDAPLEGPSLAPYSQATDPGD
ncbi:MAG TPA: NTP transferase domain-containing protein [Candidatus Limnocylindrales bacterium]